MDGVRDALLRMVKSHRMIGEMIDCFLKVGLDSNTLFQAQGELANGIYTLLGEEKDEYQQSVTHIVLDAPILSDERKATMLYAEWKKNHQEMEKMPKPNICTTAMLFKMFNESGGYMHETPEGEWI